MPVPLQQIASLTLIPVTATIIGAAVAAWWPLPERMRSVVQHFAAGVVMAAVAGELLPEMTKEHQAVGVVVGFILGVGVMMGVKIVAERLEERGQRSGDGKAGLIAAVAVDLLIDGLLIGVGFAAGDRVGKLLVFALTLELAFLGVSVVASLRQANWTRSRSLFVVAALSSATIAGSLIGGWLLGGLSGIALEIVLSFGAAALMYLVIEELLTEAHEVKETPLITAAFFAGFVVLYLIELQG